MKNEDKFIYIWFTFYNILRNLILKKKQTLESNHFKGQYNSGGPFINTRAVLKLLRHLFL